MAQRTYLYQGLTFPSYIPTDRHQTPKYTSFFYFAKENTPGSVLILHCDSSVDYTEQY